MRISLAINKQSSIDKLSLTNSAPNSYLYSLNCILRHRIAEPLRPYDNFQQLKIARIKRTEAKSNNIKHAVKKDHESLHEAIAKPAVPSLILQGQWLQEAGFLADSRCLIEVYKGMLVITPDEPMQ